MLSKELITLPQPTGLRGIISRAINRIFTPGWENHVSVHGYPETAKEIFQDNPLIVVHPGFLGYWPLVNQDKINQQGYKGYLNKVKQTVNQALGKQRKVFVFTPNEYVKDTLKLFDQTKDLILVPTIGNTTHIDDFILGISSEQFFEAIGTFVKTAEVCGEQGSLCVTEIAEKLTNNGVEVTFLNQVIVD